MSRFGMKGAGRPLLDVVHPTFPLLTTASPTLQGVLKDGFGKPVVAHGMPEPFKFPSLDSCQKTFLWTDKEVDIASQYQGGDAERFSQALDLESWVLFSDQQAGSVSHSRGGG